MSGLELQTRAWDNVVVVKKIKWIHPDTFQPKIRISLDISVEVLQDLRAYGVNQTDVLEYLKTKLQDAYLQS